MRIIKNILMRPYLLFSRWFFDPWLIIKKIKSLPYFISNLITYNRLNEGRKFKVRLKDIYYSSYDRFSEAAIVPAHYFFQDLWAARVLYSKRVVEHVDVGSSLSGFVSNILPFCRVCYVDIRPLNLDLNGFVFRKGSITNLPFDDNSVSSLSSLHVIEHIGLGRYGDRLDPNGYLLAAKELARVLKPGGFLLLGTPVGRQRLCFDGHRIFDPKTVVDAFDVLLLKEFSLISDKGDRVIKDASFEEARRCVYGCGLFLFEKQSRKQ